MQAPPRPSALPSPLPQTALHVSSGGATGCRRKTRNRMIPVPPAATPLPLEETRAKVDAARWNFALALDLLPPDPVRVIEGTRARPPHASWSNVTEAPDPALLKPSDGARLWS